MKLSVIIAISENDVIGKGDQLPWHLSADLKRFKSITTGHPIIMGRKTYESIGKPLPNRLNIIVSRNKSYAVEGALVVYDIEDAIQKAKESNADEVFIIGGATLLEEGLKYCQKIYLTRVLASVTGDVFLKLDLSSEWKMISEERHEADEKNDYPVCFVNLERAIG